MLNLLKALRQDEHGVILSAEIVIIGSLLVIGLISGLACLQKSVNGELRDVASAIDALDQTYSFSGHRKAGFGDQCCAYTAGSGFVNCEQKSDKCGDIVGCGGVCSVDAGNCTSTNGMQCGTCSDAVIRPEGGSGCGVCGGRAAGCSTCGGSAYRGKSGARCIDTGVPGMKVTEWPKASCPVENGQVIPQSEVLIDVPSHQGHFHGQEVIIEQSLPVIEQVAPVQQVAPVVEGHELHQQVIEQHAPAQPVAPVPSTQPGLVPVPEAHPIPANPMPPMARSGRTAPVVSMR